ncbi:hypothetical protein M407DRAFT_245357 [Tulasnella calospora MUT 4182]|uniref:Enoyl-CoA hydratase n=1 Tax=Tulasnella calospora MUT 4182 TaxID=1051891 RepID=A0A0C3QAJ6_9AGAM|nr:hypothetical protein M407DRAFT_245357 [Tulasnella calospora MUT 4182]
MAEGIPKVSSENVLVSLPPDLPHVIVITMNRTATMNAMTPELRDDIGKVMDYFENEPSLWVAIITGAGRAFSVGMDLGAWLKDQSSGQLTNYNDVKSPGQGIGSISKRRSKKPIIAAVNGYAVGGGFEMVLNCDLVVASSGAKFGYPEATRGVTVAAGGLPRLVRVAGHQLAAELLFTGRIIGAEEARDRFRFINAVVPADQVMPTALQFAKVITANSPDAVQSSKTGIICAEQEGGLDAAAGAHVDSGETERMFTGENISVGERVRRKIPTTLTISD